MKLIKTHKDLDVYNLSFNSGMDIFNLSKSFPKEETYSMTDQIRRSSRSVATNIAEDIHKELYKKYDWILGKIVNMINNPEKWKTL